MAALRSSAVLFLIQLCLSLSSNQFLMRVEGGDLIENTCRNTPNYEVCVSTLRSDPRSSGTRDVTVLALLIVGAAIDKSYSTADTIDKLKKSKPEYKDQLNECSRCYNIEILKRDIPEAVEGLTKGNPKLAENGMADAAIEAQTCENGFKGSKSPLSNENQAVYNLSVVARAIIRMLQ